ncbi:MAG: DUF262 domain-containing protein [Kiritimatiellae bacterium]|nr:DUF262 domain-containing protein [Kiritimatiellia bacterium]
MKIEPHVIKIRDLVAGYRNDEEEGVVAFGGKLDVRPKYQREFIYSDAEQKAVIDTVTKGYPLNVMYWAVREDGTYEVMDGQQRTLSVCEYVAGKFDYFFRYFSNLSKAEQDRILDYGLTVYFCEGGDDEKLEWFKTINIAGKELTDQELLNAVYAGPWTADMKRFFSKSSGPAYTLANRYLKGEPIRQDYMETVLEWISQGAVKPYMALHQHDTTAMAEWLYFKGVIDWVQTLFPKYRREMKGLDWGGLHRLYGKGKYDPAAIENGIQRLMADDDVTRKGGIYEYLLSGGETESALSIRKFTDSQKRAAYERQGGKCADCGKSCDLEEMHGDHKIPWSKGGHTTPDNLQMLCRTCNLKKSDR